VLTRTRPPEHTVLRLFGPSESAVAAALAEAGGETDGLEVTVCAHDLELRVDLFARTPAEERAPRVAAALRRRFGGELFAEDERPVTDVPGSSNVFLGGIVAYSDEAKRRQLGVEEELLREHGAVSGEVAAAMAKGAQAALAADVAVAVTGVAGPGGGTAEKPVGLVFIHAESPDGDSARKLQLPGDREAVRARATAVALHTLRLLLTRASTNA
jgi:nicotinamide-nucleotide amidase